MINKLFPYGFKHEFAKRWPLWDWKKSIHVARRIGTENADQAIYDLIIENRPALVGRLGGTESRFLGEYKKISSFPFLNEAIFKIKPNWHKRSKEINNNAGFYFKSISEAGEFYDLYQKCFSNTDILGAWGTAFSHIEFDFVDKISHVIPVGWTAPWVKSYHENPNSVPWVSALEHKKVLVISPFADSIQKQFLKIKEVFPSYNLHNFQLITLKPPMTINTKYPVTKSWFELLDETKANMDKIDFDVALVSAGSYSYPLALYAKNLGKIGIHVGGGLQLFFGIMGRRWEKSGGLLNFVNSSWTRPTSDETPKSALLVENGCYW